MMVVCGCDLARTWLNNKKKELLAAEAKMFTLASGRAVLSFETTPNTSNLTEIADGDDLSLLSSVEDDRFVRLRGTIE